MLPSRLARASLVVLAVAAIACGDITRQTATYTSALQSFTVYSLTNSPPSVPNAINFLGGVTRATAGFSFDVAIDLDATGTPVIYPVRTLGGALAGSLKYVGLQKLATPFASLREVPATGYDSTNAQALTIGGTVAVVLRDPTACYSVNLITSQLIYAKMVIDSVNVPVRKIYGRIVIDPNCGYRGVVEDSIPKN